MVVLCSYTPDIIPTSLWKHSSFLKKKKQNVDRARPLGGLGTQGGTHKDARLLQVFGISITRENRAYPNLPRVQPG